jgi:hypothetical protein
MRILASLLVVGAFVAGVVAFQVRERERTTSDSLETDTIERAFAPGGRIRMDLSAGEYRIEGSPDEKIRINWNTGETRRRRVYAKADVRGTEATLSVDGPSRKFRVRIEVPSRSDVDVRMTAGSLTLRGIEGNKDLELHAGEVDLDVGRAADYAKVDASVWAGELQARPFEVTKEGLFRAFHWQGQGKYHLRAHLKAGELRMSSSPVAAK